MKLYSKNILPFVAAFFLASFPFSSVFSTDLFDSQLEAERNFNSSLQYLGEKLGYNELPVKNAFQALQKTYLLKKNDLQDALLVAQNPSFSINGHNRDSEDKIPYHDISDFALRSYVPSASEETLPLHIGNYLSAVLGKGSTFYTRDDYFGFDHLFKEVKVTPTPNKIDTTLEEKEEKPPKKKGKGKGKGKAKGKAPKKKKVISLPWGKSEGADPLLELHKEINLKKKEKFQEELDIFYKKYGINRERAMNGNFVTLGPDGDPERMLKLNERRKEEYNQICSNIQESLNYHDYEEECKKVFLQFPSFFESNDQLQEIVKNDEFRFFARAWPDQSVFAFILYEDNTSKKIDKSSQTRFLYSLLSHVNLIDNPWESKVSQRDYNIKETTEQNALIPFLNLLGSDHSYCHNLVNFNDINEEVKSVNTSSLFYHFVRKDEFRRRKAEVHYFMKKS